MTMNEGYRCPSARPYKQGSFRLDDLLPGTHRIIVTAAGFAPASSTIRVAISSVRELRVRLQPELVRQAVTVSAQASFPGANYVTNIGALPVPSSQVAAGNVTDLCTDAACTTTSPISSLNQLRVPGGALGDFFGPGTTVGIPFAAQFGLRLSFCRTRARGVWR